MVRQIEHNIILGWCFTPIMAISSYNKTSICSKFIAFIQLEDN